MQNSCDVNPEGPSDRQHGSGRQYHNQQTHRTHVADWIQTADTVKPTTDYLREARGHGHSCYQSDHHRPGESTQHSGKNLCAARPKRETYSDLFGPLRHGVAHQAKQSNYRKKYRNATEQTDYRRDLFDLGNVLAKARLQGRDGWKELGVGAAGNRLDPWRQSSGAPAVLIRMDIFGRDSAVGG